MRRRCTDQPGPRGLTDGAGCGLFYDDAERSTICPHAELNPYTPGGRIIAGVVLSAGVLARSGLYDLERGEFRPLEPGRRITV